MIAEFDVKEANSPMVELAVLVIIIFSILLIITIIAIIIISKDITLPIIKLHKGTEEIIKGNLDYKVGMRSKDEVGQLSHSFDNMADNLRKAQNKLKDYTEDLEKTVKERSAELVKQFEKSEKQRIATLVVLNDLNATTKELKAEITVRKRAEMALRESEEKYLLVVENAPSVLWKTSEKGVTVFIGSNIKEVYGYTPVEIYADGYNSWLGRIHHDDLQEVKKNFQALFDKGKKFDVEYRIKRKDGEWIWARDVASVVHEENGERYAYGVFTDITEVKEAEDKVKYQATLVENVMDAILSFDMNFIILSWNKAAEDIYGWKADEVIGKNLNEVIPVEFPKDNRRDVLKSFFEKGYWKGEEIQHQKDGTPLHILSSSTIIEDEKGNQVGIVTVSRDISELKRAEQELKNYSERLEDIVKERTEELQGKVTELERFHEATVDRELRMKELRDEIEKLKGK